MIIIQNLRNYQLNFSMDYLGFFGYEQTTDLFFTKPGSLNYGL